MFTLITYITNNGLIYQSTSPTSPLDMAIPNNPFDDKPAYFDISDMSWKLDIEKLKSKELTELNNNSKQNIINGFKYEIHNEIYEFSYKLEDQQNMSDIVNSILINKDTNKSIKNVTYVGKKDSKYYTLIIPAGVFLDMYNFAIQNKMNILNKNAIEKQQLIDNASI